MLEQLSSSPASFNYTIEANGGLVRGGWACELFEYTENNHASLTLKANLTKAHY